MIKVDENDPIGELEPSFPYRDVQIKWNVDVKQFYELQSEIGRGKFGTVYKCKEKATGLALAAKFVGIARRQDRKNVEREVEIMKELQHPRLIQIYDAFESSNVMCVVLELIEGGELFERVIDDDFVLTEKACTVFVRQICEAVEFMHSKNILHLDMKPENILCLTKTGNRIKIIDFGLARKFDPGKKLQVLFGTPEFVAPEVVNFDQIGFGTDMWSVGVICYVLLSGLSPFMGETDVATMANVTIAMYDFDDDAFSSISEDAKDFIRKLLVKDLEQRMTATQCLQHAWLRRRQPLQRPKVERLESTRDNLRSCVDRWGDQSPTPFIVQTPRTFKEIDNDEPQLPELVKPFNGQLPVAVKEMKNGEIRSPDSKPSVVIPADVHMKENTLSPTSPHSPLPKKIKLQEDTEGTKSGKKSDSKSKSSTKKSKSPTSSSLNTNNKPNDSVNSISVQAPTTLPEAKEPKSNGISKITTGSSISVQPSWTQPEVKESKLNGISRVTSESSIGVQAPKTQPEVKELKLNGISKATSESSVAVQALKIQSEAKEPKFNGISKVTSGSSISVQAPKTQPEVKEPKLNGTYRVTSEISINIQAPKTQPELNSIPKVTSGSNISVQAPKTQPEVGEPQLNDKAKSENKAPSVQNLGQLGKSPVSQTKSPEPQSCRQEKMECASVTTNSSDKVNELGESRPIETSNKIDVSRASGPGSEAGISELSMKGPRDHDQKESLKLSLIQPVSPKPGPIKSDDLINHTPSSVPNMAQKPPPSPPITAPNKTNACGVNNVDLSSKVQPVVPVPTTETKTSPNPPPPQIPKPTTPEPSRVNIIPIRLEENTQTVTKQEPPQVEEKPKKPPKQLGNNISGLKSIWGSKISANEPKHHPIIKYNRTLSSPAPNTAKSRLIIGPKPQRLPESEKEQPPPTETNGPKVILHRINVDEANKSASNQASTESRLNDSIKTDSSKTSSKKSPINEWVNERLLNDRFNFDRRASDISNLVNSDSFYEDNPDGVGIRLAEEISRITDKFCRINDDDKARSGDKSALIAQERHDKITDLLNGKRRPKYRRITYLSRDVPLGSAPPPTNLAYYLTNCLTTNAASPLWAGTGCDFFSAPGTPVGSPRSPSEGSLDTDIIFQMLSKKINADSKLQNATQKKTGLINT